MTFFSNFLYRTTSLSSNNLLIMPNLIINNYVFITFFELFRPYDGAEGVGGPDGVGDVGGNGGERGGGPLVSGQSSPVPREVVNRSVR
jgi:hypothetical protein